MAPVSATAIAPQLAAFSLLGHARLARATIQDNGFRAQTCDCAQVLAGLVRRVRPPQLRAGCSGAGNSRPGRQGSPVPWESVKWVCYVRDLPLSSMRPVQPRAPAAQALCGASPYRRPVAAADPDRRRGAGRSGRQRSLPDRGRRPAADPARHALQYAADLSAPPGDSDPGVVGLIGAPRQEASRRQDRSPKTSRNSFRRHRPGVTLDASLGVCPVRCDQVTP